MIMSFYTVDNRYKIVARNFRLITDKIVVTILGLCCNGMSMG